MNSNQLLAFKKFSKLKVGALFMQMGTGKTRVALELVNYNKVDLLVYVAPFSTLPNIKDEIEKWKINCDYILIGYETISSSDSKYLELLNKIRNKKNFIIADESIFIKNDDTKRFKRLCSIRKECEYALILNGTPLTKNEWDLYNQMYFLSPLIIDMSREQFLNTFFKKITYKKYHQRERTFYKFSEVNAKLLHKMIEPYIFNCDLSFKHQEKTNIIKVPYLEEQDYYKEKERKLKDYIENGKSETIINMLTSLNFIASTYEKKNDNIIDYIKNKRVIVFCNFIKEVNYISNHIDCYVITGKTKNREAIFKNFAKDNKPLIMTFGVGSFSLNLQFCNEIVYSSITFDFSKIEQSKFRIKRIGQQNDIKYTYFLTDLGISDMVLENIEKKSTLENLIKEKMEGGISWLKSI